MANTPSANRPKARAPCASPPTPSARSRPSPAISAARSRAGCPSRPAFGAWLTAPPRRSTRPMSGWSAARRSSRSSRTPTRWNSSRSAWREGPLAQYPETKFTGSIDYDPENANWYIEAAASYNMNGAVVNDKYSGTIRWVEDPDRAANGKGHYEVNVRLNEKPASESDAFAATDASAEDAFFSADATVPGFTGTIAYVDTIGIRRMRPPSPRRWPTMSTRIRRARSRRWISPRS